MSKLKLLSNISSRIAVEKKINKNHRMELQTDELHLAKDFALLVNNTAEIVNCFCPDNSLQNIFKDDFLTINLFNLFPGNIPDQIISGFRTATENSSTVDMEYIIPVNSVNRVYQARITPVSDVLFLFQAKDVTSAKRMEEALVQTEMRFRSVWENSIDGMRLLDQYGNIAAANDAYSALVGLTSDNYLGQPFLNVYENTSHEVSGSSLEDFQKKFSSRKIQQFFEAEVVFKSGRKAILEFSNVFIESGESIEGEVLLLSIFRDISERRKAEEEIRKSDRLAAIGKMATYLSHEIKTPLASIRMNIDLLARDTDLSPKRQKSLGIIQKEIKRLNKLLRNVLQYSRSYELHIVNINLENMLNSIKDFLDPQFSEKNIQFITSMNNIKINGDYQKLQSVFLHLIENAVEAVLPGGTIELYAEEDPENDVTRVFIKDNGCGISSGSQIFEPFFTTKNTGTGLGLAIAQRIIEQHNGELKLYSSIPGETIFVIKFYNFGL